MTDDDLTRALDDIIDGRDSDRLPEKWAWLLSLQQVELRQLRAALAARSEPSNASGDASPVQSGPAGATVFVPPVGSAPGVAARSEPHSDCAELCACHSRGYHQGLDDALAPENARSEPRAEGLREAARIMATVSLPRSLGSGAQATRRYLLGLLDEAAATPSESHGR